MEIGIIFFCLYLRVHCRPMSRFSMSGDDLPLHQGRRRILLAAIGLHHLQECLSGWEVLKYALVEEYL